MLKQQKKRCRCAHSYTGSPSRLEQLQGHEAFTLLETVLALFLLTLILQGVMAVFWHTFLISERLQQSAELQYATRRARQHLGADLAACHQVQVRDAAGNNAVSGPHLYLTISDELIHYYMHNGQLYRDSTRGSPLPLAENIAGLTFSQQIAGTIAMLISAAKGAYHYELLCHMSYNRYSHEVMQGFEGT